MLTKLKQRDQKGFTIIEVMIVLAIAALILLIVLLAVPALQRNSRNTQIKNDAATVVGAMSTFASDNDGAVPDNISGTGSVTVKKGSGNTAITSTVNVNAGTKISTITTAPATPPPTGEIQILFKKTCSGNDSARAAALYYSTETSGAPTQKCIDS